MQPAAFDEADSQSGSRKIPRDGDSGGTRADQADIRLDRKLARVIAEISGSAGSSRASGNRPAYSITCPTPALRKCGR